MNQPANPERFHTLDATRAFALLLGVVFHAAWSFAPTPSGAPIVDASAGSGFYWFFLTSHTFRMQLFFLIAGFFGHLLYHRRGFSGFARHRLLRVGLPLVVGWFILFPLVTAAFVTGRNVSGGNLVELPLPLLFTLMFKQGLMFVPQPLGGLPPRPSSGNRNSPRSSKRPTRLRRMERSRESNPRRGFVCVGVGKAFEDTDRIFGCNARQQCWQDAPELIRDTTNPEFPIRSQSIRVVSKG